LKYFILIRNNQKRISFPGLGLVSSAAIHHRGLDHLFIYCNFFEFDSWGVGETDELGIGNRFFSILLAPVSVSLGGCCAWTSSSSSFGEKSLPFYVTLTRKPFVSLEPFEALAMSVT
jgi:hypothetical protein